MKHNLTFFHLSSFRKRLFVDICKKIDFCTFRINKSSKLR